MGFRTNFETASKVLKRHGFEDKDILSLSVDGGKVSIHLSWEKFSEKFGGQIATVNPDIPETVMGFYTLYTLSAGGVEWASCREGTHYGALVPND